MLASAKTLAEYVHLFAAIGSGAQQPQMALNSVGYPPRRIAWLGSSSRILPLD